MRSLATFVLSLALCLGASRADAQDDEARAAELFRDAQQAFSHDDYLEALRLFRSAYDAAPHPTVRFHIAMSLERLGRLREAWSELVEVAATAGLTPAQRRDATTQVERVRAMLVTLRIDGEPAGASVRIDDAPMCTLPCEIPVDPGDHDVTIEDATGRASAHVSGLRGASVAVHLVIEPPAAVSAEPPADAPDASSPPPTPPTPAAPHRPAAGVGWLLVTGSVVAAAGIGGTIGFGIRASDLHAAYLDDPTASLRDEGMLSRDLTNVSIGVGALGLVLVAIDVFLALAGEGTGERASLEPVARF
ncbi:MAG: PEGA domain-containing protein [Sandaracinus sp.]